ncbi:helix-turn-helix domain-containing protein [Amycolatopsis rhabdoformis]|uniref:Helix-turn-helix domain-containing protein n=1 Tax=Amycolatopsis rhabdoformis TaxID=1448059 RepID=A0ABZ1IJT2_9PSEU|nr:helix-turn-helix domain-containing protein [Amycolatopsis rhabdoformis]WSE33993.1 helix-turn-helix domain-containing protein [Amycolatopsis rhabdoformis]
MYTESVAPEPVRAVVRCLWQSISTGPKRIVPDGCVDLVAGDGVVFVAGPDTAAWSSLTPPGVALRGLRFHPGAAPAVLGVAADELRDLRLPLADLWGHRGALLTDAVLSGTRTLTDVVSTATAEARPDETVAELLDHLHTAPARVGTPPAAVSERQLRRRFTVAVGYGPATYLRVLRLQRAIALAPRAPGLATLAARAGYADQAHLSRDCRALTGLTASTYFS